MRRKTKLGTALHTVAAAIIVAGVSACGSASDISARNANYVGVSLKDGVLSGTYNPAGYDSGLIQNQIRTLCVDKALAGYAEKLSGTGLVAFSASCASGTAFKRAFMEIERMPNGNFVVEVTGS